VLALPHFVQGLHPGERRGLATICERLRHPTTARYFYRPIENPTHVLSRLYSQSKLAACLGQRCQRMQRRRASNWRTTPEQPCQAYRTHHSSTWMAHRDQGQDQERQAVKNLPRLSKRRLVKRSSPRTAGLVLPSSKPRSPSRRTHCGRAGKTRRQSGHHIEPGACLQTKRDGQGRQPGLQARTETEFIRAARLP